MSKTKIMLCIFLNQISFSYEIGSGLRETIITDPSITKKCEILITNRKKKVSHRQKLIALAKRNQKLQTQTPSEKESVRKKLIGNLQSIKREIILTNLKVRHVEEDIIRRGCPGIKL